MGETVQQIIWRCMALLFEGIIWGMLCRNDGKCFHRFISMKERLNTRNMCE